MSALKVFIVEDEPDLVKALIMRLKAEGYQTVSTTNGSNAVSMATTERPDIILLDISLPGCDGFSVFQQLKQNPVTEKMPVVFFTAHSSLEERQKARHLGAAGYVVKPFQWAEFIDLLHQTLAKGSPCSLTQAHLQD